MAIDDLLDEHEQSERVLAWLRRNGAGVVGGVLLGLALIGGWQWWQRQQQVHSMHAGDDYQAMLKSIEAKDLKQAQVQVGTLADTPYAALAALDLAKAQLGAGKRDAAIATLRATHAPDAMLQRVVDQRLARLLIDAGKPQDALRLLAGHDDPASLETSGDAQMALGKRDEARKAYSRAMTGLDVAGPQRRLLEIKLTDVGGASDKSEAQT